MSDASKEELYFCCDWGTTSFRLSLFSPKRGILSEYRSADGVAKLAKNNDINSRPDAFCKVLTEGIEDICNNNPVLPNHIPVLISGMASSSIGYKELPYATLPFSLGGDSAVVDTINDLALESRPELSLSGFLISGVAATADVMRGEEVQVLGILDQADYRSFSTNSVVLLPGTHSKHIVIKNGSIDSFQSYMTGELFQVVSTHTVVQHSVAPCPDMSLDDKSREWFSYGLKESANLALSGALFRVRARSLLEGMSKSEAAAYLSGILLGAELNDLRKLDAPVLLAADNALAQAYCLGLEVLEKSYTQVPSSVLALGTCLGQIKVYTEVN